LKRLASLAPDCSQGFFYFSSGFIPFSLVKGTQSKRGNHRGTRDGYKPIPIADRVTLAITLTLGQTASITRFHPHDGKHGAVLLGGSTGDFPYFSGFGLIEFNHFFWIPCDLFVLLYFQPNNVNSL
jgi:hypothetical protein